MQTSFIRVYAILLFVMLSLGTQAQYNFDKVEDWLQDNLKTLGGRAVLMIYKDGKVVYQQDENQLSARQKRIGKFIAKRKKVEANLQDFTPDTKLRIASCSKWLSAALVMTFVDKGELQLTDTIGHFLPIFTQYGKGHITIADCLSHQTGIYQPELKEGIKEMTSFTTMEAAMQHLAKQNMEGEAGKTFHYGNAGLQIAAAILEKISGKDFETIFAERITRPLQMTQTDFGKKNVPLAAGGAYSSTKDYMNFLIMLLQKGQFNGQQILSAAAVEAMQVCRTHESKIAHSPAQQKTTHYGFGEWIEQEENGQTLAVSSPDLFGSVPFVHVQHGYCFFLMTMNLTYQGRQQRYADFGRIIDQALGF